MGERLYQYLVSGPLRTAIEDCLAHVGSMDNIHFRFITDRVFPDVPFEAFRDVQRSKFVRDMSPLARSILPHPGTLSVQDRDLLPFGKGQIAA